MAGAVAWITLTADRILEQIEISGGAQLVIAGSAKNLTVDSITDDNTGHLYIFSSMQLQINSLLSPCTEIFHGAELILSDIKTYVSLERTVDIYGMLTIDGAPSVFLGKRQGMVTMHPGSSPSALNFGELIIESSGHLRLMNYDVNSPASCRWSVSTSGSRFTLSDSSKMDVDCPFNLTGDQMNMGLNSALKIKGNSSVSYVSMNDVKISGTFDPGVLSLLEGWKTLRIERYGDLSFFPYGDVRLDTLYSNGNFHVEGAVYVRGRDPAVTRTIEVDGYGSVQFDLPLTSNSLAFVQNNSQEFGSHGRLSLNGVSLVHADIVAVDGTWLPKKLKIEPGWKEMTVGQGGMFHFDPVGVFNLNKFNLDGNVTSMNAVKMTGLSQERIVQCEVGFYGVVLIESRDLTTMLCQEVFLSGTLRIGNLSIGSLWDTLTVNGNNGKFYFETSLPLSITQTRVSGLLQTGSAVRPLIPITGESFIIESTGQVSIHYQAQPSSIIGGAMSSTFHVTTVQVDGLFKLGSFDLVTDNLNIGTNGKFYFATSLPLNINRTRVSGLLQIGSAVSPSAPLTGESFIIESTGQAIYHYQAQPSSIVNGTINSTFHVPTVQVDGLFRLGPFYLVTDYLTVGTNGQFYFKTSFPLNINRTRVSGLLQIGSAVSPSAPLTGKSFIISSTGQAIIHYQAQPSSMVNGTINSTFHVPTVQVDGLFKLGSFYLVTDYLTVGTNGQFYFETSFPLKITRTRVSGLLQIGSSVGLSAPLTGESFIIASTGQAIIHYQAQPSSTVNGTISSMFRVPTVQVDGLFELGPFYLVTDYLTVGTNGKFYFKTSFPLNINRTRVSGLLQIESSVSLSAPLTGESFIIASTGQAIIHYQAQPPSIVNGTISSMFRVPTVQVNGLFKLGPFYLVTDYLTVGTNGKFYFKTSFPLNINRTRVSGLLQIESPVGPSALVTGESFIIESTGQASIHYQAKPSSNVDDAINSTFYVTTVQVNGLFKLGSFYLVTNYLTVGTNGKFFFETSFPLKITRTQVSGLLQIESSVGPSALVTGKSFIVASTGEASIHYQAQPSSIVNGTISSMFLVPTVQVDGLFKLGSYYVVTEDLTIGTNGKFYFETSFPLNITRARVSGLLQTGSAVGPSAPLTGESFIISSTGQASIHYQAQPSSVVDGAINSTFHVTTVQIDGMFNLGSLYLVTDDLSVGSSGRISVNGGGALGGMGPGAGTQKDSGGSGASYGGRGGRGTQTLAQPLIYGDIFSPGGWGSGGGNGVGNTGGGRGGGRIFLDISNSFIVNGIIQMNGLSGQVSWY